MDAHTDSTGKTVVVTGSARGLGLEMGRRFAAAGAEVVLTDVDARQGERSAEALRAGGGRARFELLDVREPEQSATLVDRLVADVGQIDVWVNNAGVAHKAAAEDLPVDQWRETIDVMLSGVTVYTPEFYVRVDDTCSGLHSVASLLMLGVVAAHLFPMSGRRQALVLALVLPLGLLANALRIASLVPVGLVAGRGAAAGLWHDLSAVACFALAYAALFAFARRLARSAAAAQSPTSSAQTDHEKASPAS